MRIYRGLVRICRGSFADVLGSSPRNFKWLEAALQGVKIFSLCCGYVGLFCGNIWALLAALLLAILSGLRLLYKA